MAKQLNIVLSAPHKAEYRGGTVIPPPWRRLLRFFIAGGASRRKKASLRRHLMSFRFSFRSSHSHTMKIERVGWGWNRDLKTRFPVPRAQTRVERVSKLFDTKQHEAELESGKVQSKYI